jgi:hypothetical protein
LRSGGFWAIDRAAAHAYVVLDARSVGRGGSKEHHVHIARSTAVIGHVSVGHELTSIVTALAPRIRRIVGDRLEFSIICAHDPCIVAAPEAVLERLLLGMVTAARNRQERGGWLLLQIATAPGSALPGGVSAVDHAVLTLTAGSLWTGDGAATDVNARPLVGLAALREEVRALGGQCTAETEPGGAETLSVFMPLSETGARGLRQSVLLRIRKVGFRMRVATLLRGAGFAVLPMSSPATSEESSGNADVVLCDSSDPLLSAGDDDENAEAPEAAVVVPISMCVQNGGAKRFILHDQSDALQPRVLDAAEFVARVRHLARHASHRSGRALGRHA